MENELCVVCGAEPTKVVPYTEINVCDNLACHVVVVENIISPEAKQESVVSTRIGDVIHVKSIKL